jgi:hypothetical protein
MKKRINKMRYRFEVKLPDQNASINLAEKMAKHINQSSVLAL